MMRQSSSATSFRDAHSPTRFEINEYLSNVSSFDRYNTPKAKALLSRKLAKPTLLNLADFLLTNTQMSVNQGRVMNPNETRVLLKVDTAWKEFTTDEKQAYKLAKWKCNLALRAEGKDPKRWTSILKMEG